MLAIMDLFAAGRGSEFFAGHEVEHFFRESLKQGHIIEAMHEVPFVVARIVLQDFTGVPLLVDLAAMRSAVQRLKYDPAVIEPLSIRGQE